MDYIIIGLLVVLIILTVISLFKNINESNITERLGKLEVSMMKEMGNFKNDLSRDLNDDFTKLNEGVHELMFLKTDLEEVNLCKILVDVFYGNITEKYVKDRVNKFINAETDWKIKSGFTWNDYKVWLSSENQFNYKAAYDLAVQTNGASLPVTFKFGDNDNPVYHEFTTLEELTDFYTKVLQYINTTLKEGWDKKDSIDWSLYNLE